MTKKFPRPDLSIIDFANEKLCAFFSDGRGYVSVTAEIIDKIIKGELVVTEYHETPLGNVIYLSGHSSVN